MTISTICCPKCRQWHDGVHAHICIDKTHAELRAELASALALLAQRNVVIGEMGMQIERLRARVRELEVELDLTCLQTSGT